MAKKMICYPFRDGNLCDYVGEQLDTDLCKRVYDGENITTTTYANYTYVWKPQEEKELTLQYIGYTRGRSAVTFWWKDQDGHQYPMFLTDFDDMFTKHLSSTIIHAVFTYQKRGQNYGIKFLRNVE